MIYGCGGYGCFYTPTEIKVWRAHKELESIKRLEGGRKAQEIRARKGISDAKTTPGMVLAALSIYALIPLLFVALPILILLSFAN